MEVQVSHPVLKKATTNTLGGRPFHVLHIVDRRHVDIENAKDLALFIDGSWSDWDALVRAVDTYRAEL